MATAIDDRPIESDSTFDLDAALNEVAGHLNAQHARLVDLTIAMLARRVALDRRRSPHPGAVPRRGEPGWHRTVPARSSPSPAAPTNLPECIEAFRRGELAVDQIAAIAARAPWWTDNEVSDLAKFLTAGQLRRRSPGIRSPTSTPPGDAANPATDAPDDDAANPGDEMPKTKPTPATTRPTPDRTPPTPPTTAPGRDGCTVRAVHGPAIAGLPDPDAPPVPRSHLVGHRR